MNKTNNKRQSEIIRSAQNVFKRYGYKKTSMDDLAKAAGLSRQGLYLHFPNKQALFKTMVMQLIDEMRIKAQTALKQTELSVEKRIVDAFDAMFGYAVDSDFLNELFLTMVELIGAENVRELESELASELAQFMSTAGIDEKWEVSEVSALERAKLLFAASDGIKNRVRTQAEYRKNMRIAVQVICR